MVAWQGVEDGGQRRQGFCGIYGRSRLVRPFMPAEERFFWAYIFHFGFLTHVCIGGYMLECRGEGGHI